MSWFTKKLPKNKVVWCIAIPYTEAQFKQCYDKKSDFLESLKVVYHCTEFDNLWRNYDCFVASKIQETILELQKRNVVIVNVLELKDLQNVFSYDVVILTAHKHNFEQKLDLMGDLVSFDDFVSCIPDDFRGTLDLNSCYSAKLLTKITLKASENEHIIGVDAKTNVLFKLFLYKSIIEFMVHHNGIEYFEAFRQIGYRIIQNAKDNKGNDNVYLGGDNRESNQYGISFPENLLSELVELTENRFTVTSLRSLLYERATTPRILIGCYAERFEVGYYIDSETQKQIEKIVKQLIKECKVVNHKHCISVFAPEETRKTEIIYVQAYIYENADFQEIEKYAIMYDKTTSERGKLPLCFNLKNGDKIDLTLSVKKTNFLETQTIEWQGNYCKVDYYIEIPSDYELERLYSQIDVSVNGALIGNVKFVTTIVDNVEKHKLTKQVQQGYNHIFISYAHNDVDKIKYLAEAYEAQGVDYFFDKKSLRAGDIWPEEIQNYITQKSDLFVLCWSVSAAKSKWCNKEKDLALPLAYPQIEPEEAAKIKIHPIRLSPEAIVPEDMKQYQFCKIYEK